MKTKLLYLFLLLNLTIYSQTTLDSLATNDGSIELPQKPMRRNVISVDGLGWYSLFLNLIDVRYDKHKNDELVKNQTNFTLGGKVSYIHYLKKRLGLGFEYDFERFKVSLGSIMVLTNIPGGNGNSVVSVQYFEKFKVNTHSLSMKLEWARNNVKLPLGVSHQMGIGVQTNKVIEDDYFYEDDIGNNEKEVIDELGIEINDKRALFNWSKVYLGAQLFYSFNLRYELSNSFLLNFGIKHTFNYVFGAYGNGQIKEGDNNYQISENYMLNQIGAYRTLNITTLNLGISYIF